MPKLFVACVALLSGALTMAAENCATLEACLAKYPSVATSGPGVGERERELAEAVQRYGASAIPPLLRLLRSDREDVRTLAAYTLRDIEGLTAKHLAPLIEARRNGDGWIPPAIASVGTPEAVAFLVEDLRQDPETHTQVTWALEKLGAKAALALTELLECDTCDDEVLNAAVFMYSELQAQAAPAVPELLRIARDETLAVPARQSALLALGHIGDAARPHVAQLQALARATPSLERSVQAALTRMGAEEAVPDLVKSLPQDPDTYLAQIGSMGKHGYSAGPAVLKYLDYRDWDIRVAAAGTLGEIAYLPARQALEAVLTSEDDWKLVYGAVLSLARLKAPESIEPLKRTRDTHWYPPVRKLAQDAIGQIEGGVEIEEPYLWEMSSVPGDPPTCTSVKEATFPESRTRKLRSPRDQRALSRLEFDASITSYGPPDGEKPGDDRIIEITQDTMVERVSKIRQAPHVALKVADGWLAGSDRGEWGGELVHLPAHGAANVVHDGNVEDIYLLGEQLVATAGVAHLAFNKGVLLKIDRNDSGRYFAAPWKRLPAAPRSSWLLEGGELLVNTYSGGSVIIDAAGHFRMAQCTAVVSEGTPPEP